MTVIEHLERFLGPIEEGWSHDIDGQKLPFQVVRFSKSPVQNTHVYATIGLSNKPLRSRVSDKQIHQELVVMTRESDRGVVGILQQVGLQTAKSGDALLRGDVIGPRGPLLPSATVEALYVSIPVYFPDEMALYQSDELGPVVIAWIFGITSREAEFVFESGWDAFEDRLIAVDPNLLDLSRDSIV